MDDEGNPGDMLHDDSILLTPRARPSSRWERSGISARQERALNFALVALVALFTAGWSYGIALAVADEEDPAISRRLTENPLSRTASPPAAFLLDATVRRITEAEVYRGESRAVRVIVRETGEELVLPEPLPEGVDVELEAADGRAGGEGPPAATPRRPGIWNILVRTREGVRRVPDLAVLTPVPLAERRGGRIGQYLVGEWPFESSAPPRDIYRTPRGLVEVTPETVELRVSEHITLGDLLTKGQADVWPKYVIVSPRMLDKVELTIQEIGRMTGRPVENVGVISAFRTPYYNQHGGSTGGRGALSRHMFGDAMDFYIDNERDGRMDDLNGDGRVDIQDARMLAEAAERVERRHPHLVGGIGIYRPTGAHSGFVHVDTRGFRARW